MVIAFAKAEWDPDAIKNPEKIDIDEVSDSNDTSEESSGSGPCSEVEAVAQEEIVQACNLESLADSRWRPNVTNGSTHRGKTGDPNRTMCNNAIGNRIIVVAASTIGEADGLCSQCFGRTLAKKREMVRWMSEPLKEHLGF